jgi:hypothetical protein
MASRNVKATAACPAPKARAALDSSAVGMPSRIAHGSKLRMAASCLAQVSAKEGDDAATCVAGGWFVVAGCVDVREHLDPERQLCRSVVVQKAMARIGIHLDVMVDAGRSEHRLKAIGNLAYPRPAVLGAVAPNDRAGAGQAALRVLGEPAIFTLAAENLRRGASISASPPPMQKPITLVVPVPRFCPASQVRVELAERPLPVAHEGHQGTGSACPSTASLAPPQETPRPRASRPDCARRGSFRARHE